MGGLENASKPPLRILVKRMVNQSPNATTGEAPPERQMPYQQRGDPSEVGSSAMGIPDRGGNDDRKDETT
ncbi:hypothetical protein LIER_00482 [Lithospermum erythrorhizon]|uniref:Uncharacterized protein n=1 Tax=Lithospermum erythrorhizon TaxID=34254 RepID=A0AAV3NIM4_LITER